VKWLTREKMTHVSTGTQRFDYEAPIGGGPVRYRAIRFLQYINALESMQTVGSWTVNVLCQKLSNGDLLTGEAYDDFVNKVPIMDVFMEAMPRDGDITESLFLYYRRRIAQCLAVGKPPASIVLSKIINDVTWTEGMDAQEVLKTYHELRKVVIQQPHQSPAQLWAEIQRRTEMTTRGQEWCKALESALDMEQSIVNGQGERWVLTYQSIDAAVNKVFERESVRDSVGRSSRPRGGKSTYSHALRTEADSDGERDPHKGRSYSPGYGRGKSDRPYQSRTGGGTGEKPKQYTNRYGRTFYLCGQCGCYHSEERDDKCPFRPKDGPAEFKGWSMDYCATLPASHRDTMKFRMTEVTRTHPAYLDSAQRKQFWEKVEEQCK
jgi:hypothetical protein